MPSSAGRGPGGLRRRLAQAGRVGLDSMVFMYLLQETPAYVALAREVLETIEKGKCEGVVAVVSMAEILTRPAQFEAADVAQAYLGLIAGFPHLEVVPVGTEQAWRAAELRGAALRAGRALRSMDALVLATAELAGATAVVSNDRRLRGLPMGPDVIALDDFAASDG